jgi:MFS family permease
MSVGPALGGFLAAISFRSIFVVDAITSILAAAILFFFRSSPHVQKSAAHVAAAAAPSKSLLRDAAFLIFLVGVFLNSFVFFQHEGALPLFLVQSLHQSTAFFGLLFTINTVIIVALEIPINSATADWPHSRSLGVGAALITIGFGALAFATSAAAVVVTVLFWTFGEMLLFPSLSAYLGDVAPAASRGVYMGAFTTSTQLGFALGTSIGAYMFASMGVPNVWLVVFGIGVAGTVVLVYSSRGHVAHSHHDAPIVDTAGIEVEPAG